MVYDKSQIGWILIGFLVLVIVGFSVAFFYQIGDQPLSPNSFYASLVVFISLLLLLYKLRIKVDEKGIHIIYGIGIIRFNIMPKQINYVKATKTSFIYGWGIRIIPGGILYSIQGSESVEISYHTTKNKLIRIGTTDSENLIKAIKARYNLA